MDTLTRWTGISALVLSSFSFGASAWVVGCRGDDSPKNRVGAAVAASPRPSAVAVQTAVPIAAPSPVTAEASASAKAPAAAPGTANRTPSTHKATPATVATTAGEMRVKRLVVTRKVEAREPVSPSDSFTLGETPLYAFVELENRAPGDEAVVITFEKPGHSAGHIELGVPGNQARWRTWGMTRGIRDAGNWHVVVRTQDGKELARKAFQVVDNV